MLVITEEIKHLMEAYESQKEKPFYGFMSWFGKLVW